MGESVFAPSTRCTVCSVPIGGQPIRHHGGPRGAGYTWGPSCATHENWHPTAAPAYCQGRRVMKLLDAFCCEGGAGWGYALAGFDVLGIDIDDQPLYPLPFKRTDALDALADLDFLAQFDAIHASPPCQHYVELAKQNGNADDWPDLIEPVRDLLVASGKPYVIENVDTAPLVDPVTLCGTMFPPLRVLRHRLFETNWPLTAPPHGPHPLVFTHDKRKAHYGKLNQDESFVQVTGGGNATIANKRAAMGMPWASNHGCNEAVPPAYTEYVGRQLIAHLEAPSTARPEVEL